MIDLHSHILPGIDDGSVSLEMSLEMARLAFDDGTRIIAATPHILPGVYDTLPSTIAAAAQQLSKAIAETGIDLQLVTGADVHVVPDLVAKLRDGRAPCFSGTRYFLFEPPHHVCPPGLDKLAQAAISTGFVPILTHPERLTWIEHSYDLICLMEEAGAAIQLTAGSVTGGFGERAQYWSHKMLDEGRVDIIASDAHHPRRRPPGLSRAAEAIAKRLSEDAAKAMVLHNPRAILDNVQLPAKQRTVFRSKKLHSGILGWLRG